FFTTLAAFPAALAVASCFALASDRAQAVDDLLAIAGALLPSDIAEALADPIRELLRLDNPGIALAAALVLLLWTASGYATAFGRAVNAVYEVQEGRMFWAFRGRMLLVAVLLVVLAGAIVLSLLSTPAATEDILGRRGLAPVVATVWDWARWPVILVLMLLFVACL